MKFYEQLEKHSNNPEEFTYIKPHYDWLLQDYKDLHSYLEEGWIVTHEYYCDRFIINPEWEDEPLWTPPQKKKLKFKIVTKEKKGQTFCDELDSIMNNLVITPEDAREMSILCGWNKKTKKEMKKLFSQ